MAQDATEAEPHDRTAAAASFELRLLVDKESAPIFGNVIVDDFDKM